MATAGIVIVEGLLIGLSSAGECNEDALMCVDTACRAETNCKVVLSCFDLLQSAGALVESAI